MTEAEWLTCSKPIPMLELVKDRGTDRQFRLFNCACVRRVWDDLKDQRLRDAITAAEQHADGLMDRATLARAVTEANRARGKHDVTRTAYETVRYQPGYPYQATSLVIDRVSWHVASSIVPDPDAPWGSYVGEKYVPVKPEAQREWVKARNTELAALCEIARDIFGNPFRPIAKPNEMPSTVKALAQAIYDERTFDHMPELADALERAGGTNQEIVDHCRGANPHVRGCWALDLLLSKA